MIEKTPGHSEDKLDKETIGNKAQQLIQDARRRLIACEGVRTAITQRHFMEADHTEYNMWRMQNHHNPLIGFTHNGIKMSVSFDSGSEENVLRISTHADHGDSESIILKASFDMLTRRLSDGVIQYATIGEEDLNITSNTQTAVSKISEFLTSNFPLAPES